MRCENIPKSWFKAPVLSLFIFLFIHLWNGRNTVHDPLRRIRSSHSQVLKRQQLNLFSNFFFTGNRQSRSLIIIKFHISSLQFYQKRLQHRCFTVSFSEFFWRATFNNISGWLLLVPCKLEITMLSLIKISKLNETAVI